MMTFHFRVQGLLTVADLDLALDDTASKTEDDFKGSAML